MTKSEMKNLDCCCWKNGHVTAQVGIPRRGFVSGEMISVSADIDNKSNKIIEATTAKLVQVKEINKTNQKTLFL